MELKYLFECEVNIEKGTELEIEIYNNEYETYNIKIIDFEIKYEYYPYLEIKIEGAPFNVMYMQLLTGFNDIYVSDYEDNLLSYQYLNYEDDYRPIKVLTKENKNERSNC